EMPGRMQRARNAKQLQSRSSVRRKRHQDWRFALNQTVPAPHDSKRAVRTSLAFRARCIRANALPLIPGCCHPTACHPWTSQPPPPAPCPHQTLSMTYLRRYLVQFHPKRTPHFFTDILVIGAGIAGLRAALEVPPGLDVLVVTKDRIEQSNSAYAQGGIAGVMSSDDRFENHIEDTLTAGGGLCDRAVVEMVVREAPEQIQDLIRWGTNFDEEDGQLALTREGGHSHRRIVHALGDATGFEVMRAIIARARQTPNVSRCERAF